MDTAAPYTDLYIYYFDGPVQPDELKSNKAFIGNWEEDGFSFLFFSANAEEAVAQLLIKQSHLQLLDQFEMSYDEWQGGSVEPFSVGCFTILPPWKRVYQSADNIGHIQLLLDPGVVFGTGTHVTTHDCLEAIERVCYETDITTAVDIGTGTGILAIAASLLSCHKAIAVDLNHLAVMTTRRNIVLNGLEEKIVAVQGRAEHFLSRPTDLVMANIHFDVMRHIITSPDFLNTRYFLLSGLMRSEARHIEYRLSQLPVEIMQTWERDHTWFTYLGRVYPNLHV